MDGASVPRLVQERLPLGPRAAFAAAAQVDEALRTTANYVAVGPIFGTATKDTGYTARGLDLVRYAAGRGKPVVAIGGITLDNARSVLEAGATALAVITDLLQGDPESRTRAFVRQVQFDAGRR